MNLKWKNEIIFPEFERNVINRKMIEDAYLQSGYKGEVLRLHQLEPFDYKNVTVLRLEFLNIVRIDNLWMMPNLTKLSLSGNKIEMIENLETLTSLKELKLSFNFISEIKNLDTLQNLETLSLLNNLIATISGVDELENLQIFNLGNNKIESLKGLERLRFLKKLIVLNMEGNPVFKTPDNRMLSYVIAVLPQIKYYEYALIEDRDRDKAMEEFKYEIVEIETAEDEEIKFRNNKAKELEAELRYSSSFVEFLDDHQLYNSLWDDDEDGHTLLQISDSAAESLLVEYRESIFAITQEIFKLGLQKFDERKQEIDLYMNRTEEGKLLIQKPSLKSIEEYNDFTDKIFKKTAKYQKKNESRLSRGKDSNSTESISLLEQLDELSSGFYQTSSDTWHALVRNELHLHESILESISYFDRNMQQMVTKFIEGTQMYFVQIRNIAIRFSDNFGSVVQEYLESKFALKAVEDVPDDLKAYLENKSLINELVSGMQNHHLRRIDDREKRLITRSKQFVTNLIEEIQKEEFQRNRGRILEINDYVEHMKSNFQTINVVNREDGILHRYGNGK